VEDVNAGSPARNPFGEIETDVQSSRRAPPPGPLLLIVERGPDAPKRLRIDEGVPAPTLVGSSPVCALRLGDPAVSRRHLALETADDGWHLRDTGSTNGTRVDGVRVVEALLDGGERIEIGHTVIRVERDAAAEPVDLPTDMSFGAVVGRSTRMRRVYPLLARLAQSTIPIVIEGETGTGKEAVAEAIHQAGPRAAAPFVVFDCTATASNLLESELFGHERGAFTGAVASRPGVFQQAHRGTLLIDEIGDLDLALQPKLLRAIERSEVRPLGGTRSVRFDVRLIAATRRDLDREVHEGRFRDDLFHRLAVARVELPPLRLRQGDIAELARHFWNTLARESGHAAEADKGPPADLLRRWEREPWPGNVRQLRNAVARTLALGDIDSILSQDSIDPAGDPGQTGARDFIEEIVQQRLALPVARERVVHEFERRYLEDALARHGGSIARAARESGIATRYFRLLRSRRRP
jgi:DNA-binding NtrC family response regulator